MPYKDPEKRREYYRKYYSTHKEQYYKRNSKNKKKVIERNFEFVREHKLDNGCSICGYKKSPRALEFHHIGEKRQTISTMCAQMRSIDSIKGEMLKCILVCSNCHREIHDE